MIRAGFNVALSACFKQSQLCACRVRLLLVVLSISSLLLTLATTSYPALLYNFKSSYSMYPCDHRGDVPDHSAPPEPHLRGETTVDQPSELRHAVATSRNGLGSDSVKGVGRLGKYAMIALTSILITPTFLLSLIHI